MAATPGSTSTCVAVRSILVTVLLSTAWAASTSSVRRRKRTGLQPELEAALPPSASATGRFAVKALLEAEP
eukprot:CAMPEP_0171120616 /NCGR_PEP_ID=MMETSP0766_2-20121228/100138_1 /TAXON_ID=439317 /ORGANISM="Gambierdiscus australes, Strain CAWD 149" /LENGTH=70 /DNA_ID=CAMNT_0011583357 /DNA_START=30 /DNA_END=238 /DNA_ORIENTATION=-